MDNTDAAAWISALRLAPNEEVLVGVIRDYMATWTPRDLARIPEHCRPGRIERPVDVLECAVSLAREELRLTGDAELARLMAQIAAVFTEASARLAKMPEAGRPG